VDTLKGVALNAGTRAADVTVEIVDASGATLTTSGPNSVNPGAVTSVAYPYSGSSYCRVTGLASKKAPVTYFVTNVNLTSVFMYVTTP
jgi:hypothetical protein